MEAPGDVKSEHRVHGHCAHCRSQGAEESFSQLTVSVNVEDLINDYRVTSSHTSWWHAVVSVDVAS